MLNEANDQKCLPLYVDCLPDSFIRKAQKELNERPETSEVELQTLTDLLSAHRLSKDIKFEKDFIKLFLRHSKYNSTKAFQSLQKYLEYRRNHSRQFQCVPDVYFENGSFNSSISLLPYRSPEGCVIILHELGKWNPNEFPIEDLQRMCFLSFFQPLRCPLTQISGFKVIYDMKDTVKLLRYCTLQNLSLAYNTGFNCLPARYKEIHFINNTLVVNVVWSMLKHVLPEKIKHRLFFHSKPDDLLNHFPKFLIPSQYGGCLSDYHDRELMRKLNKEHRNFPLEGMKNYF